jgi:hypothetical protein
MHVKTNNDLNKRAHANANEFIIRSEHHKESGKCQKAEKKKKKKNKLGRNLKALFVFGNIYL